VKAPVTNDGIRYFRGPNPRKNLPAAVSRKRGESNFTRSFERAYLKDVSREGFAYSDFDLHGYGVADLVHVSWSAPGSPEEGTAVGLNRRPRLHVIAFEMKLKDWSKALMQAFRYSYFADRSVVVLPPDTGRIAVRHAGQFRALGIGLWTFDKETGKITKAVAPGGKARSAKAREKAIAALLGATATRSVRVAQFGQRDKAVKPSF
jgi:hypothetical protein